MQIDDLLFILSIIIIILYVYSLIKKLFKKQDSYDNQPVEYQEFTIEQTNTETEKKQFDYSSCNIRNRVDLINFIDSINTDKVFKIKEDICVMESYSSTTHYYKK